MADTVKHGTRAGYVHGGCREECCAAPNRAYRQARYGPLLPPFQVTHGTRSGHANHGCRCRPCTAAANDYNQARKRAQKAGLETRKITPPVPPAVGPHCAGMPTDMFFPVGADSADYRAQVDAAVAVCTGCPAREACHQGAVDRGEQYGIWGGVVFLATRQKHRGRWPASEQQARRDARAHGTEASYQAHRYLGETACDPCIAAHHLYNELRREAR